MLLTLFHSPCGTPCLTISREPRAVRYPALAIALPSAVGVGLCVLVNLVCSLI